MSGSFPDPSQAEGELVQPPGVPEEFVAAYRAAYEEALAAQSVPATVGEHADPGDDPGDDWEDELDLPRRSRPIAIGTHRASQEYDDTPTWFERLRDSGWLVPVLLLLLALLLVIGAYVVGRAFAGRVSASSASPQPQVVLSSPARA